RKPSQLHVLRPATSGQVYLAARKEAGTLCTPRPVTGGLHAAPSPLGPAAAALRETQVEFGLHVESVEFVEAGDELHLVACADFGVSVDSRHDGLVAAYGGDEVGLRAERLHDFYGGLDDVVALGYVRVAPQVNVFRADAHIHLLAVMAGQLAEQLVRRLEVELRAAEVAVLNGADHEVHSGRADEAGH